MQTMQNLRLALLLRRARWPKHPTPAGAFWIAYALVIVPVMFLLAGLVRDLIKGWAA